MCVAFQVKSKNNLKFSQTDLSEPRCVQKQHNAACVRGVLAAVLVAFGTAVLKATCP